VRIPRFIDEKAFSPYARPMQVFTILGSHPALSNAEFEAVTGIAPSLSSAEVSIFDDVDEEITKLQAKLGGIPKMGAIISSFTEYKHDELAELLASLLIAGQSERKTTFGISIYDLGNPAKASQLQQKRQALGLEVKKKIKNYGQNARYVTSRGTTLSAVDIRKNQILDRGAEFCLLVTKTEIFIGQTMTIQDYEDWGFRDFDRPSRDAKRGMLPPKLARMMVNLAGVDSYERNLLDPFCGSGTVLMEAVMLGYDHVIGSDILEDAVTDTRTNMEWLAAQGHAAEEIDLHHTRAANVHASVAPDSIDVVVTEPFLGKPRQGDETEDAINVRIKELTKLYTESFASIAKTMRKDAVAVVAFPVNFVKEKAFEIPVEEVAKASGLKVSGRPLLYRQKGQYVGRMITRLTKAE